MAKSKAKILVVDDNSGIRAALKVLLPMHFLQVELIPSPKELVTKITNFRPDVVLLDMNFHTDINTGNEGLYWLSEIKKRTPDTEVVLFTAYADIQLAVEGMKRGAFDFIVKPWDNDKLLSTLKSAMELRFSRLEIMNLKEKVAALGQYGGEDAPLLIGESPAMQRIKANIERFAKSDANILLLGENGTGKDVVARLLHSCSQRSGSPFVAIDLGSVPEQLFESELFGYEKGAFTGAGAAKAGRMEVAAGGTLFLDEIGNLPLLSQAKLLTAIEKREIVRVGGTKPK